MVELEQEVRLMLLALDNSCYPGIPGVLCPVQALAVVELFSCDQMYCWVNKALIQIHGVSVCQHLTTTK